MNIEVNTLTALVVIGCNSVTNPVPGDAGPSHDATSRDVASIRDTGPTAQQLACRALFARGFEVGPEAGGHVSFREDVMPIFGERCNFGGCHEGRETIGQLRLGDVCTFDPRHSVCVVDSDALAPEVAELVHSNLLQRANAAPLLKRVEPGQPDHSFMLMKLSGCQDAFPDLTGCTSCGSLMPPGGPLLEYDRAVFATLRRWIAQGAELE